MKTRERQAGSHKMITSKGCSVNAVHTVVSIEHSWIKWPPKAWRRSHSEQMVLCKSTIEFGSRRVFFWQSNSPVRFIQITRPERSVRDLQENHQRSQPVCPRTSRPPYQNQKDYSFSFDHWPVHATCKDPPIRFLINSRGVSNKFVTAPCLPNNLQ